MKIHFLKDTYIRKSPAIAPDNILGVARKGDCLRVEKETVEGQAFRAVSNWYRDFLGRYYWAGAAEPYEEKLVPAAASAEIAPPANEALKIREAVASVSEIGEESQEPDLEFDPQRMNILIRDWAIIERFWRKGNRGEETNIAILSTGIDFRHPDLGQNIKMGYNFCTAADRSEINDLDGEGTAIAGLIAAQGGRQVYGLAPGAGLFIGKIAEKSGSCTLPRLVDALYWLLDLPVELVYIGASFLPDALSSLEFAALDKALRRLEEKGCLVVAPDFPEQVAPFSQSLPGALPACLAVAAQELLPGSDLHILQGLAAPGENLLTTTLQYRSGLPISGPMAAAAVTCGLLALIGQAVRKKAPSLPFTRIWEIIRRTGSGEGIPAGYLPVQQSSLMQYNME